VLFTLYGARGAPNPRRVEIFLAEHGLVEEELPPRVSTTAAAAARGSSYAYVDVDMSRGQHKRGGQYATPNQKLPMVLLPDGTAIGESVAICRWVEESRLAAAAQVQEGEEEEAQRGARAETARAVPRLFGRGATQRALIEMWQRRVELELLQGVREHSYHLDTPYICRACTHQLRRPMRPPPLM
jgi:glutathione S-transferase